MRELRVEDALLYLDQVKVEFGDRPHIYNEFLDIMKTFKTQQIDTPGVIRRVSNLFQGNTKLVLGFNTFLPEGYKIEIPLDGDGTPLAVFRAPGETITHILSGPGATTVTTTGPAANTAGDSAAAAQNPQAATAAAGRGMARTVPLQAPISGVSSLVQGLGQRPPTGSIGQQQGVVDRPPVAAVGAAGAYPPHQAVMRMQQGPGRLGQPPQMMSVAGGAVRTGLAAAGQSQQLGHSPDQKAPHHGHPGMMQQNQAHLGMHGGAPAVQQARPAAAAANAQPQREVGQPLEFDHAINYVTTIKKRFSNEPETYKKFLEILHTYQKEQRGIKEVLEEVSVLFSEHPDLLKEFTYFLPDAVQAEAKAQLEIVAKEAEARKRAADARKRVTTTMRQKPVMASQIGLQSHSMAIGIHGMKQQAPVGLPTNPIPFGATQGRSAEREKEIFRGAVYGIVSFAPARPPRKSDLAVSQAAAKNGRPSMLPALPVQPTTAETVFFDKAKRHLNRRELAPDKPSGTRRHTPHTEFLKCLHLYGGGVLNKDELMLLLRGLFVQGHAPKSGANAGGGASNPSIANDAHELLKEFEQVRPKKYPKIVPER
jgi:histone deacetylase complex regulatory component SIN3